MRESQQKKRRQTNGMRRGRKRRGGMQGSKEMGKLSVTEKGASGKPVVTEKGETHSGCFREEG